MASFSGRLGAMRIEYTIEMIPPTSEAPLKNHVYRRDNDDDDDDDAEDAKPNDVPLLRKQQRPTMCDRLKYHDEFHDVEVDRPVKRKLVHQPFSVRTTLSGSQYFTADEDKKAKATTDYRVIISTEVNGRTVAQKTEKLPPPPVLLSPVETKSFLLQQQQQPRSPPPSEPLDEATDGL